MLWNFIVFVIVVRLNGIGCNDFCLMRLIGYCFVFEGLIGRLV